MLRRVIFGIALIILSCTSFSQTGGNNIYEFLNLTHSGLISSLGGANVSVRDNNPNKAWHNPSLLNPGSGGTISLNYTNYFAGINYGMAMYSLSAGKKGSFAAGISYLNHGTFTASDASGNILGEFHASESALSVVYSRSFDSLFSVGINIKPVISSLERYNSLGIAFDLGASWHTPDERLSAGIVLRNAGVQITRYTSEEKGRLPFEIMAGITVKPEHAPFRLSFTLRHLEKFRLVHQYMDPDKGNQANRSFSGNLSRHIVVGAEFIPSKNFYMSAGYNHQRRSELAPESGMSGSGFSWGFGINTSSISIELGRASFHPSASSTNLSLLVKPGFFPRKARERK